MNRISVSLVFHFPMGVTKGYLPIMSTLHIFTSLCIINRTILLLLNDFEFLSSGGLVIVFVQWTIEFACFTKTASENFLNERFRVLLLHPSDNLDIQYPMLLCRCLTAHSISVLCLRSWQIILIFTFSFFSELKKQKTFTNRIHLRRKKSYHRLIQGLFSWYLEIVSIHKLIFLSITLVCKSVITVWKHSLVQINCILCIIFCPLS